METKKTKSPAKKVVNKKVWTVQLITYNDGSTTLNRTNDGFYPLELLGICTKCIYEINDQTKGVISPTIINRKVIKRK